MLAKKLRTALDQLAQALAVHAGVEQGDLRLRLLPDRPLLLGPLHRRCLGVLALLLAAPLLRLVGRAELALDRRQNTGGLCVEPCLFHVGLGLPKRLPQELQQLVVVGPDRRAVVRGAHGELLGIERLVDEEALGLAKKFVHAFLAGPGDRLVGGDDEALDADGVP